MNAIYAAIVESARLENLKLLTTACGIFPFYSPAEHGGDLEIQTTWENVTFLHEDQRILGSCEWAFVCNAEGFDGPPVTIRASYLVEYRAVGDSEEIAVAYLKDVGRMAAYPYFRTHVATLLSGAQLMLPPLPVITMGTFRGSDRISARIRPSRPKHETPEGAEEKDAQ